MTKFHSYTLVLLGLILLSSCRANLAPINTPIEGDLTKEAICQLQGLPDQRKALLKSNGMTRREFVRLSTDSAWHLTPTERQKLRDVRLSIPTPDSTTLLQKAVAISKLKKYDENQNGGRIDGFVARAADVKHLKTLEQVYWGLRLDYEGTAWNLSDSAYAVIRFYSNQTHTLTMPICEEMQGQKEHCWPCSGGGFTASTLGKGGYPEWEFPGSFLPKEGAQIFIVDRKGHERLHSIFRGGRWEIVDK